MRLLLALAALPFLLAGCGDGTTSAREEGLRAASTPTWPATGCDEHSGSSIDYVADARGDATREKAAAPYMKPGDQLVREAPQPPHMRRGWVVVTPDHEIRAIVSMFRGKHGFLVDGVEKCAG